MNDCMKKPAKRIHRVSLRLVKESSIHYPNRVIRSPQDATNLFYQVFGQEELDREHFIVLGLDTKNIPNIFHIVAIGSLNAAIITPRECYKAALLANCAAVIFLHNHPSGNTDPSEEDILVTQRLEQSGSILGVEMLDHIIVGNGAYLSLKERGFITE